MYVSRQSPNVSYFKAHVLLQVSMVDAKSKENVMLWGSGWTVSFHSSHKVGMNDNFNDYGP